MHDRAGYQDGPKKTVSVVVDWVSDQRTMTIYEDALSSNGTHEAGSLPISHPEVKKAGIASEETRLTPRPPSRIGKLA